MKESPISQYIEREVHHCLTKMKSRLLDYQASLNDKEPRKLTTQDKVLCSLRVYQCNELLILHYYEDIFHDNNATRLIRTYYREIQRLGDAHDCLAMIDERYRVNTASARLKQISREEKIEI